MHQYSSNITIREDEEHVAASVVCFTIIRWQLNPDVCYVPLSTLTKRFIIMTNGAAKKCVTQLTVTCISKVNVSGSILCGTFYFLKHGAKLWRTFG